MIPHGLIRFTPLIMKYECFNKTYIQYFITYLHGHVHVYLYFLLYSSVSICCSLNFPVFIDLVYASLGQVKIFNQINNWNLNDGHLLSCPYILFEHNQIQSTIFGTKLTPNTNLLVFAYTHEAINPIKTPTCLFIDLIYLAMSFLFINCYGLYNRMLKTCIFILMIIWKQVFNNKHHALSDLYTSVNHYNWNKFYHYGLICGNTDPHNVYRYNYCNNHYPKTLYYPTEMYVCTCTTELDVFCTGAYNYYPKNIITITLQITHLIQIHNIVLDSLFRFTNQIILNKLYLYYMYPIINIRGHYIF